MATDPDILRVIDKINKRIESLQQTKHMLLREFGIVLPTERAQEKRDPLAIFSDVAQREAPNGSKMKRKEAIVDFLKQRGPATRGEIIKGLKIPRGTVGFYLTDQETFMKTQDDKWTVRQGI